MKWNHKILPLSVLACHRKFCKARTSWTPGIAGLYPPIHGIHITEINLGISYIMGRWQIWYFQTKSPSLNYFYYSLLHFKNAPKKFNVQL
jgi:hypothetical protein